MQTRRVWIIFALALMSCRPRTLTWPELLPTSIGGTWTRTSLEDRPLAEAPQLIRTLGLRSAVRATYTGPAEIHVSAYLMAAGTSFEAAQKWRVMPGCTYLERQGCFYVIESPAGKAMLDSFASALDRSLAK